MEPPTETEELKQARIIEPSTPSHPVSDSSVELDESVLGGVTKKRRVWPVIVAIGAFFLLTGGSVTAYNLWYQNPDRVIADAVTNLLTMEQMQQTTTVSSDTALPLAFSPIAVKGVEFNSVSDVSRNSSMKLDVDVEIGGGLFDSNYASTSAEKQNLRLSGEAVSMSNGDFYFKLNNMRSAYLEMVEGVDGDEIELSARANELIDLIDNTWVQTSSDVVTKKNDQLSCALDVVEDSKDEVVLAMHDIYRENKFLTVKDQLPTKDGDLGYRVAIDQTKVDQFYNALKKKKELSALSQCLDDDNRADLEQGLERQKENTQELTFDIWISRWGHQLRQLTFESPKQDAEDKATGQIDFTINSSLDYDTNVEVSAPKDVRTIGEWQKSLEELFTEILTTALRESDQQVLIEAY